jgi:hypothetical protein
MYFKTVVLQNYGIEILWYCHGILETVVLKIVVFKYCAPKQYLSSLWLTFHHP